jgi:ribosome biogenesis GTPase
VSFAGREQYRLFSSQQEMSARVSGALRHSGIQLPVVGDWVEAEEGIIRSILPRRTKFSRRAAGRREDEQVIATNIDVAFIVCGLDGDYNPRRIERYLVLAKESGARAVVVLNKADLREPPGDGFGVPMVATSTRTPDGLMPLLEHVRPEETIVLLGSSGAGKSSILNALIGDEYQRTKDVREHDSRGRHTTTHRELFQLPCGAFVIDTPGMRELQLWAEESSVEETFDEVRSFAEGCRFSNCRHRGEPGCAVTEALESGELDEGRWANYQKLTSEIRQMDKKALKKLQLNMRKHYKQKW